MNEYYLENNDQPLPDSNTSSDTMKRYIKEKYVNKRWVSDDPDPVKLFQNGKFGKKKKSKKKKRRKHSEEEKDSDSESEEKVVKRKKKKSKRKKSKGGELIDVQEDDGFDDFVTAGPNNDDDGFAEFESAPAQHGLAPPPSNGNHFAAPPSASTGVDLFGTPSPAQVAPQMPNVAPFGAPSAFGG